MRTMLKITMPVQQGSKAIRDGSLPRRFEAIQEQLQPESSYFFADRGRRCAMFVFDMDEPSKIPQIAEPLFQELDAEVEFCPVMNADDLRKGLAATGEGARRKHARV